MRASDRVRVAETFRSIFYAPQFVTLYGGHFAAEGFDVEVRTAGGGVTSAGALVDGSAKVWGFGTAGFGVKSKLIAIGSASRGLVRRSPANAERKSFRHW